MDYTPKNRGDKWKPTADEVNAIRRAATKAKYFDGSGDTGMELDAGDCDQAIVMNDTGETVAQYAAVVINAPLSLPDDTDGPHVLAFKNNPMFKVKKPTADKQPFGIVTTSLKDKRFGTAVFGGLTNCLINLVTVGDTHVDVVAGSYVPKGSTSGAGQIVWVKGGVGTATATGNQLAVIKLGGGSASADEGEFPFMVKQMSSQNQPAWDWVRSHGLL